MDNTMIVSHKSLFIHLDLGYVGSYNGVTILRHSQLLSFCVILFSLGF